jgi:hypothetical protein
MAKFPQSIKESIILFIKIFLLSTAKKHKFIFSESVQFNNTNE